MGTLVRIAIGCAVVVFPPGCMFGSRACPGQTLRAVSSHRSQSGIALPDARKTEERRLIGSEQN